MMKEIGQVKDIYWRRKYFGISNFEDLLFIKVELYDRTGTFVEINFDDELKISTANGLLTFIVSEIVYENDFNDYSKILVIAQLTDDIISSIPHFENKTEFANKLILSTVYKEV